MKKAFTLIELIVVLLILVILISLIITGVRSSVQKAYRLSCAKNIHSIIQALQFAVEDEIFVYNSSTTFWNYADAKDLYGLLYYNSTKGKMGGITDLKTYVCPATKHLPPTTTSGGYNNDLACNATNDNKGNYKPDFADTAIDYWVVKKQKTYGDPNVFDNPNFSSIPKTNVVLWEASDPPSGVHHKEGRNIGFWNGSVRFIASYAPNDYPVNLFDNFLIPSDPNNGKPECDSTGNPITVARDRYVHPYP